MATCLRQEQVGPVRVQALPTQLLTKVVTRLKFRGLRNQGVRRLKRS